MVCLKRVLIFFAVLATCTTIADAFPGPRTAGSYVLKTAKNLWSRENTTTLAARDVNQPMKLIDIIPSLADDRRIKPCQEGKLGSGPSKTWKNYHEICSYPFDRSAFSENVNRSVLINRLVGDTKRTQPRLVANWSEPVTTQVDVLEKKWEHTGEFTLRSGIGYDEYNFKGGISGNRTEWATNPRTEGTNPKDGCQLCTSINDNYVVPRGYIRKDGGHQCVCKKWAKGDEKFMVCNCDLCDAFTITEGLRNMCMEMLVHRTTREMLTVYAALDNHNVFIVQYNDWKGLGKAMDFLVQDVQKDLSVCKSGIQGRKSEDKHRVLRELPLPGDVCPRLLLEITRPKEEEWLKSYIDRNGVVDTK